VVQGGDEKPLIGKNTPVQLQSTSYKGLFLLARPRSGQVIGQGGHTRTVKSRGRFPLGFMDRIAAAIFGSL